MSEQQKSSIRHSSPARSGTDSEAAFRLRVASGIVVIAAIVFLAYLPCINGGFVLDDDQLLTANDLVKSADGLYRFCCTSQAVDYWPATNTAFWLEWRLWGLSPTGYHATNLIFHVVESLMVWIVLRRLSVPGAFFAALIFAVHPVNVESVAWIASRKNLMAMAFFLLAILWYLKYIERRSGVRPFRVGTSVASLFSHHSSVIIHHSAFSRWYWLSLAAFLLAMLSKGSAAVLPIVLLGIAWWQRRLTRRELLACVPFFLVAVLLAGVNIWFQRHGAEVAIRAATFTERLLGAGAVVWFYLYEALLPLSLAFIYPQWAIDAGKTLWWLPFLAALAVTMVLLWRRDNWARPFLFAWGFFCVALVPVMGFADVGFMRHSLVADHYQHMAVIGVIALAAVGVGIWHGCARGAARGAALAAAAAAVVVLAFLSWRQSGIYRGEIALYEDTLAKNPQSWLAHNNLGVALAGAGPSDEAIRHYEQALILKPDYYEAENNLGNVLSKLDRQQEAIEHYQKALSRKPDLVEAHYNLGYALFLTGELNEAIEHYRRALHLKPDSAEIHNKLAVALVQAGKPQEAIEHYRRALKLNADYAEAHNNWGVALDKIDRLQEAIEHYRQALRIYPDYTEAHNNLGVALVKAGRYEEAVGQYRQLLRVTPDSAEAYSNLALTYARMNRSAEAVASARKALDIARKRKQESFARQIEEWLASYEAGPPNQSNAHGP